jgi:hypothetical protein
MANLFDPKNPNTWPENYKRRSTEAFTNKGVPARDLAESRADNRFASNAQTPVYNAGGDFNFRGMQTPYENYDLKPSNLVKAGITAMGPGAAKDIINGTYLFGKTVVHGSPQQGLKEIVPRTGSGRFPEDSIVYGWNPTWNKRYPAQGPDWTVDAATGYTGYENTGSIYVGKIPRKDILIDPDESMSHMVLGSKPIRVKKEFPQSGIESPGYDYHNQTYLPIQGRTETEAIKEALVKALRRNGVGVIPKNKIGPFVDKNMDKIKEILYKRLNKIPENIA